MKDIFKAFFSQIFWDKLRLYIFSKATPSLVKQRLEFFNTKPSKTPINSRLAETKSSIEHSIRTNIHS